MALVVFTLDGQNFAVPLPVVERVVNAVEVGPLPGAPRAVAGVIAVGEHTVPVFDLRARFELPPRALEPEDLLIIARRGPRLVALPVETVPGLREVPRQEITAPDSLNTGGNALMQGVARLGEELILIHDLDKFLTAAEEQSLAQALEDRA